MNSKIGLLLILLLGTLLVGFVALGFYYAQPFSETITLKDTIPYNSLIVRSHFEPYRNSTIFDGAVGELGTASLNNKGSVSHEYTLPQLGGCVHFPQKGYQPIQISMTNQFDINQYQTGYYYPSSSKTGGTLKAGAELKYTIYGSYYYYAPLETVTNDIPDSISIYKIDSDTKWPLLNLLGFNELATAPTIPSCNNIPNTAVFLKNITITR
jgi:hypothetical protein